MSDSQSANANTTISMPSIDSSMLQIRLDTKEIIQTIEIYLKGEKIDYVMDEASNSFKPIKVKIGDAKCNPNGIHSILNWIQMIINPSVVQGNYASDQTGYSKQYEDFCYYCQVELGCYLIMNLNRFDIEEFEYQGIIDSIMNIVRPFMTRLIDNEERKSYNTLKEKNQSETTLSRGGIPFFR